MDLEDSNASLNNTQKIEHRISKDPYGSPTHALDSSLQMGTRDHNNSLSSETSFNEKLNFTEHRSSPQVEKGAERECSFESRIEDEESEEGVVTQRRRKKLEFFENEIRKIDNEESESNLSQSHHSFNTEIVEPSPPHKGFRDSKNSEETENTKLKRKLEAINRVQLLNQLTSKVSNDINETGHSDEQPRKLGASKTSPAK
jgi:hypothetical protein